MTDLTDLYVYMYIQSNLLIGSVSALVHASVLLVSWELE